MALEGEYSLYRIQEDDEHTDRESQPIEASWFNWKTGVVLFLNIVICGLLIAYTVYVCLKLGEVV